MPHTDPLDPPRRRANQARGHGSWDSDRPPACGVVGRVSGRLRLSVERHADERAGTCAGFLGRALAHFAELGLQPVEAVMTDGARCYRTAAVFQDALMQAGARHIVTPPYTPRWNGKVERFIGTLKREWAYAHSWPNSAQRSRALASFLRYYNRRRPHSSLGDRPPISRVHNVRG